MGGTACRENKVREKKKKERMRGELMLVTVRIHRTESTLLKEKSISYSLSDYIQKDPHKHISQATV